MSIPAQVQDYIDLLVQQIGPEARVREESCWFKIVSANPNAGPLQLLMEFAAADIWGGCTLSLDGDCFEPPPWTCILVGPPFCMNKGKGNTPEEAIGAALKVKAANPGKPEGARFATEEEMRSADWGVDGE